MVTQISVLFGGVLLASAVWPTVSSGQVPIQENRALEEIMVTATRRAVDLQDVPVSVSVVTGDDIQVQGIQSSIDITAQIPNVGQGYGAFPFFSIRGVQLLETLALGNEPPVGVYFDSVYQGSVPAFTSQLFDLDSVEVLRGPQGTLFGRNTTGGLIDFKSRKPSVEPDGYLFGRVGQYNQLIVEAAGGGALGDRVRGRASMKYNRDSGFQKNLTVPPGGRFGSTDAIAGRLMLEFDVTEDLVALVTLRAQDINNVTPLWGRFGLIDPVSGDECDTQSVLAGVCVDRFGFGIPNPNPKEGVVDLEELKTQITGRGLTLNLTWDIGPDIVVNSVTSLDKATRFYQEDFRTLINYDEDVTAISQEVRLAGGGGRLQWQGGIYYYEDERFTNFDLIAFRELFTELFGPVAGSAGLVSFADIDTRSISLFGHLDYDFTDALSLTAGLRYTDENKDLLLTDSPDPAQPLIATLTDQLDQSRITGTIGLNWRPASEMLVYTSVSTGFKSGAFNTQAGVFGLIFADDNFTPEQPPPLSVSQEEITSYELGLKTGFWGGRGEVNTAIFYSVYDNIQLIALDRSFRGGDVPLSRFLNAGDVDIYGAELELRLRPADRWLITFGAGLLSTKIDSEVEIVGIPIDGNELPLSPAWDISGSLRYDMPVQLFGGGLALAGEFNARSSVYFIATNTPLDRQSAYEVVNFRALWASASGKYEAAVFAENVFDEHYLQYAFATTDVRWAQWAKPRWVGASFRVNF